MSAPQHPLVELAHGALSTLEKLPRFGDAVKGHAAELERAWVRAPLSVAIGGAVSARTELFNFLCGRKVLDPQGRPMGCASLRVRRGKVTRFKATRDDGSTEEHVLPPEQADDDALRLRAQGARAAVDERKLALVRVERVLPRVARARPKGFMIWLWPLWWLLTRHHRRALSDRQMTEHAYDQAYDALKHAEHELETSAARIRVERGRFFESLRALSSGPPLGSSVRVVELELGEGPLPPGVDLVEMVRPKMTEDVDAVLLVERDAFYAPHTAEGDAPKVGTLTEIVPTLLALLGRARALVLSRQAREDLEPAVAALDDDINDTEESFRVRIERLEAMQILDAEEFVRAEIAKVKQQVSLGIRVVVERSASHLASELDRLGAEWSQAISTSQDTDQLKSAVARIEQSAHVDARRIAEEVRGVALQGAAGCALEMLPELLATLRPHGLEEPPPRTAPPFPTIEILPSLTNSAAAKKLTGAAGWLTGLFKSFDSRRTDVLSKAGVRIASLRELAASEMLASEPKLREGLEHTLHLQLRVAIERQVAWLDRTLTAERAAVVADGIALAPLARTRDQLKQDLGKLVDGIAQLERENPGVAAAAVTTPRPERD